MFNKNENFHFDNRIFQEINERKNSKNIIFNLKKEINNKNAEIAQLSKEKINLAEKLLEASTLIEDLYNKYDTICAQKNLLHLKYSKNCHNKGTETDLTNISLELSNKEDNSHLSSLLSFQGNKGGRYIITQNNSENDEVLIGPETPVENESFKIEQDSKLNLENQHSLAYSNINSNEHNNVKNIRTENSKSNTQN